MRLTCEEAGTITGSGMLVMALVFSVSLDSLSPIHAWSCPIQLAAEEGVAELGRQEAGPELRSRDDVRDVECQRCWDCVIWSVREAEMLGLCDLGRALVVTSWPG